MQDVINDRYEVLAVAVCAQAGDDYREMYRKSLVDPDEEKRKGYKKMCETLIDVMEKCEIWELVTNIPFSDIANKIRREENEKDGNDRNKKKAINASSWNY